MSSEIEITEVRIRFPKGDAGNIVAWASCLICGGLILDNIEVLRGRDGALWVNFPSRPSRHGHSLHFFYPINRRTRTAIEKAVLDEFSIAPREGAECSNAAMTKEGHRS